MRFLATEKDEGKKTKQALYPLSSPWSSLQFLEQTLFVLHRKDTSALKLHFTPSSFRSSGGMKNGSSGQNNHAGIDQRLLFLLFVCCCQKKQNCDQNQTPAERKTEETSALWKYFIKYFRVVFFISNHFKAGRKPFHSAPPHTHPLRQGCVVVHGVE